MTVKVIIRNTPPAFYDLAARAAKSFVERDGDRRGVILEYESGPSFWVKRTKAGNISVSGERAR